jgi:hypothetical protein
MSTVTTIYGAANSFAVAATLASPNYDLTGTVYNSTVNKPVDVMLEYAAQVAANPTGNKQIVLFVQGSLDATSFGAAPSSVTDTTHDTSMRILGSIATNGGAGAATERGLFSIAAAFGGVLPAFWRVFVKNDCGVATSSCAARTQEINLQVS